MGSRCLVLALLASCYGPTVTPGSPCSQDGSCPAGLVCHEGRCELDHGRPGDAPLGDGGPDAPFDAATDGGPDAPDAPAGAPWGTPVALTQTAVNTAANETDPSITNNRLTLYFVRTVASNDEIFVATRASTADPFGSATAVAELNTTSVERSPEISSDGQTIYFTSNRSGNLEVYASRKVSGVWTGPLVVSELSGSDSENDVAVSPDQLTAVIARGTLGSRKLLRSTRASLFVAFSAPIEISALNVTGDVAAPTLTNGATEIYFHAGGVRDLFGAVKSGTSYTAPAPVTALNTTGRDASPFVLQSNDYLVFEREGNLFEASR